MMATAKTIYKFQVDENVLSKILVGCSPHILRKFTSIEVSKDEHIIISKRKQKHPAENAAYLWSCNVKRPLWEPRLQGYQAKYPDIDYILRIEVFEEDNTYWRIVRTDPKSKDRVAKRYSFALVGTSEHLNSMLMSITLAYDALLPRFERSCGTLYATPEVAEAIEGHFDDDYEEDGDGDE